MPYTVKGGKTPVKVNMGSKTASAPKMMHMSGKRPMVANVPKPPIQTPKGLPNAL